MSSIDKLNYALKMNSAPVGKKSTNANAAVNADATAAPQQPAVARDGVTLTSQAQELSQIPKQVSSDMSFDSAKVARLKAAVESGEYQVNPEKLAANLLKLESDSH
ncbi:flagellar biosynthesis anti-sigma factor FlgM [Plesiomonas shigelloides]|uniref:Negative regulator of flagellin synthesis n=1 Tax=Plesiomonas shigelloides TaxID=703 RepID=A0A8I1W3A5_PLESH|nr:flagellar biosynthesis anti-sigma factor FlgM [Plesiomonas shigelloides]MBO1106728.1 flagellar biosynthesis anti-sigma factor FlgM [Plesiomonas shigelloides]